MYRVEVPVDFAAVIQVPVTQDRKPVPQNLVSFNCGLRHYRREVLLQQCNPTRYLIRCKEEFAGCWRVGRDLARGRRDPSAVNGVLSPFGNLLAEPRAELVPAHAGKSVPGFTNGQAHWVTVSLSAAWETVSTRPSSTASPDVASNILPYSALQLIKWFTFVMESLVSQVTMVS